MGPFVHVFVVGRQEAPGIAAIRAVVQDWSAVGLLGPSVWIDPGGGPAATHPGATPESTVTGLRIDGGLARTVELRSWMPRNPGPVRVVSVQSLSEPGGSVPVHEVAALLEVVRLPPSVPLVNLLIPAERTEGIGPEAVFDSQVNVLVQPVDASDPQAAIEPLTPSSPTFAMHAAAAVCTAAGLWTGMAAAPLDHERPWSGAAVAVGRAYVRRLDATAVLDRLAHEVYGPPGTLPPSRTQLGEPMPVVAPAVQLAAAEAAGHAVLTKHAAVTRFNSPAPFQPPPAQRRRFGETVALFFSFLGRAVVRAPKAWFDNVMLAAGTRLEQGATRFFYGQDSGYQVVVTGLTTDRPGVDQARALQDAAAGLLSRIAPGSEPPVTRVPQLWDDAVRTVAALADGGDQDPSIPLPGQNARLVVDNPAMLCSRPDDQSFRLPHGAPGAESGPIAPTDPYHAMQVDRALEAQSRLTDHPGAHPGPVDRVATLAQLRQQLAAWVGARRNAMWAISTGLAVELDSARRAHAELLAAGRPEESDDRAAALAGQRRVRIGVLAWLTVLLVAIVASVVLRVTEVISTGVAVLIGVLALLICLIGAFLTFASGQRMLWQAIHRAKVAAARREWLELNAIKVAQEEYRLGSIYRQSQVWAQIVAEHVHAPFGAPAELPQQQTVPARLTGDLPLAVAVASAEYLPQAHGQVVYQARGQLLRKDWLASCIDLQRRLVIVRERQQTGRDLENRLSTDADLVPGGPLLSYLESLRSPAIREQAWSLALTRLVGGIRQAGMGELLLPSVRVEAGAIRSEQSWSGMAGALLAPKDQLSYDGFSPSGITNLAPAVGRSLLATDSSAALAPPLVALPTTPTDGRHQLDRFIVRWDLTHPAIPEDLTYFGSADGEPARDPQGGPPAGPIIDVRS